MDMESIKDQEMAMNLPLLKRFVFYQLFDPNTAKIFEYNVYKFINIIFIGVIFSIVVFSLMSFFTETNESLHYNDLLSILHIYVNVFLSLFKILRILCKTKAIWNLLDITRANFLKSRSCLLHNETINKYRETSIRISYYIFRYYLTVFITWLIIPVSLKIFVTQKNPNQRYSNIYNMRYPVSVISYNKYYYAFYIMELGFLVFNAYIATTVDIFLISICLVFISQYKVLRQAFERVGHDDTLEMFQYSK